MTITSDLTCERPALEAPSSAVSITRDVWEVELRVETHQFLVDEAAAAGVTVGQFAAGLIEEYTAVRYPVDEADLEPV